KTFFEFKHRTSSGNERDVEVFTSKVIIQGKEYLHTIVHDVTEKKKLFHELVEAKEKAEESDRLKSAFLANMSHEIRTPLNGIIGFTDLLTKNDNLSKQKKKKYSGIINRSTESLMQLINDILDISRLETNQVIIKPKPFDLNVMLNGLLTLYKEKIADKEKENIKFEMLSPGKKFQVAADENRLIQIFINLLDNALKFTAEGEIRFGLDKVENGKLYFVVTDTGIGIKRERQEMIFDRFAQAEDEIATLYGGTGLGLSIVRKLVKLMNGNISVESEPGKGAIFRFNIPFIPVDIKHDDVIKNNISPGEVNSLKILVIEDDPLSLDYFKELLNNKGFELISAITGREGLQIALKEKPDVILLDIRLPDINGLEIIQEIKSRHASIKIIVQSAFAMDSDKEKAFKAGCDDFIAKPVNANLLLEKIGTKL
ncbi:MAG: ATP-binding protein, partial [Bacteroidota bacterium]